MNRTHLIRLIRGINILDAGYVYDQKGIAAKLKSLRETYRREVQKVEDSEGTGTNTDGVYRPTLAWFDDAEFWRTHVLTRSTRDTMVLYFNYSEQVLQMMNYVYAQQCYYD